MIERFVPATGDEHTDKRAYIEAHLIACRECDFTTGDPTEDNDLVHTTHNAHYEQTRHTRFWKYTISRSTGRTGTISELRPGLRSQGHKEMSGRSHETTSEMPTAPATEHADVEIQVTPTCYRVSALPETDRAAPACTITVEYRAPPTSG